MISIIKTEKLIDAPAIKEIGDQLARFGNFCGQNFTKVIQKFVGKIENFDKEKFAKVLKESEILLRVIDDAKFASTEDLQEIRARIMAREYNNPNSISMRAFEEMKKLSAKEFLWFEENIAPYCFDQLCFIFYRNKINTLDVFRDINPVFQNLSYNFSYGIQKCQQNNLQSANFVNNKLSLTLSINAMQKLDYKMMILNAFGVDLCKICQLNPSDSYINDTTQELIKFDLIKIQDFYFRIL